jgi:hypothetical protein
MGLMGLMRLMGGAISALRLKFRSGLGVLPQLISPMGPIRFSDPAVSIAVTRVPPLPTPKRRNAHTPLPLLKRPVYQTAFQQPKHETGNRVEEELVQVDEKGRGKLHRGPILPRYLQS